MGKLSQVNLSWRQLIKLLIVVSTFLSNVNASICREKTLDENIKNADVIITGLVRRLERNYSESTYSAFIQIHRILKGLSKIIKRMFIWLIIKNLNFIWIRL